jgi:predicted chitinase
MAKKVSQTYNVTKEQFADKEALQEQKEAFREEIKKAGGTNIKIKIKVLGKPKVNIKNPIEDAGPKDAFRLGSTPKQFYLRFGYLLQYIHENITPRIKIGDTHSDNPQMFDIDFSTWENYMYSLPNQISLDPRVCLVRNSNFYSGNPKKNTQVFQELPYFRAVDNGKEGSNTNLAYPMNIYLNFDFILECLKTDDKGDVSVFEFLSSICTGLNKALGGINNLEPVIDESTNTLSILDTTPIPGETSKEISNYTLQVYGYDKNGQNYISNFVRNIDLKTAITPEFATMITIGATAGGYVKGTEATAFSKWNVGLTDRFKEEFTPGNENSVQTSGADNEAEVNYAAEFASQKGYVTRYGLTGLSGAFKLNTDTIERNLSVVTEYYKYILAKEAKDQPNAGGTVGFIPYKLNLTIDGISGIKIYNKLSVNTEFLPKVYGEKADLIVTGVSHNLSNNDWTTQIETTLIPKTGKQSTAVVLPEVIQQSVNNGISGINSNDAPLGANPPSSGWEILHPKYPNSTTAGKNIDLIIDAFKESKVTNPYAIVGALTVIGKESGWIPQNEGFDYTKERLPEVWGAFSKTGKRVEDKTGKFNYNDLAAKYAGNPEKIANFVYGVKTSNPKGMRTPGKDGTVLGNKVWGDGWKYRGRGFNQITWKSAYKSYGEEFGIDLINYPDKLNEPKIAAKAAISFFKKRFKEGGIKDPVSYWNKFTSVDEALVYFAKANSGSLKNDAEYAITKSREKRKYFDIVKK